MTNLLDQLHNHYPDTTAIYEDPVRLLSYSTEELKRRHELLRSCAREGLLRSGLRFKHDVGTYYNFCHDYPVDSLLALPDNRLLLPGYSKAERDLAIWHGVGEAPARKSREDWCAIARWIPFPWIEAAQFNVSVEVAALIARGEPPPAGWIRWLLFQSAQYVLKETALMKPVRAGLDDFLADWWSSGKGPLPPEVLLDVLVRLRPRKSGTALPVTAASVPGVREPACL